MITLPPDFKDFLQLLNDHNVKYLLVGGYAVALHGYVRYTSHMDIWIMTDPENAARVIQVLKGLVCHRQRSFTMFCFLKKE